MGWLGLGKLVSMKKKKKEKENTLYVFLRVLYQKVVREDDVFSKHAREDESV